MLQPPTQPRLHLPLGRASATPETPGPERRWSGEDTASEACPPKRVPAVWFVCGQRRVACGGGRRLEVTFLTRLHAFVCENTDPPVASDSMCSDIMEGTYFAQKHALLVVETSFAFPETNDGAVFSFGGQ